MVQIAILGDFNPDYSTHHALSESLRHITKQFTEQIQFDWIGTGRFDYRNSFPFYSGLWIAPGSPYKDMQNVLNAIRFTRVNGIPTFGNCGGFQHMIIEFARNVCGIKNADHEETNPHATDMVISKLFCSLIGQEEELTLVNKTSRLYTIINNHKIRGRYYCRYGINHDYIGNLRAKGLSFTSLSPDGEIRSFELPDHPFFLGTLFQPALTSTEEQPDPIIIDFVKMSVEYAKQPQSLVRE
jgi:CTP synthase (UTP-ammonia lyase)